MTVANGVSPDVADEFDPRPREIDVVGRRRASYWNDPNGHNLDILTRS